LRQRAAVTGLMQAPPPTISDLSARFTAALTQE
jgi:hypothetical protein